MRSKRNFCIDIILACLLLGIIAYIVAMVQVGRARLPGPQGRRVRTQAQGADKQGCTHDSRLRNCRSCA